MLGVWEDGNPYSVAFSSSSFVVVILLTCGQLGLEADTTSCMYNKKYQYYVVQQAIKLTKITS